MVIYIVHNSITGKVYIGKTKKDPHRRWAEHVALAKKGSRFYFHSAIRKYGSDAFSLSLLSGWANSEKELSKQEQHFIDLYQSDDDRNGYNLTKGGDGAPIGNKYCVGRTLSDVTKQKISMKAKGRPTSDTLRLIRSKNAQGSNNPMYGRSQKETTRNLISQKRLEREKTDHTSSRNVVRVNHIRWHVNRGIVNDNCSYCEGAL